MGELGRLAARELSSLPRGIGEVHDAISARVFRAVGPVGEPVRVIHDAIARGTYAAVGGGVALAAHAAAPYVPESDPVRAAVNGLIGDTLDDGMELRRCEPGPDVAVYVHGLGELETYWGYVDELDWAPALVRYNTGRSVAENGAALAALLERIDAERLALIGHSMGGLVIRSACAQGGAWTSKVHCTVALGTPHTGAPLAQGVHWLARGLAVAPETRPFGRFLDRRSAGIRDLRRGLECAPLPGVKHHFLAATVTTRPGHPVGRVIGDWLVLERSASVGEGEVLGGMHHIALLNHPAVLERLRVWLA